MLIEAHDEWLDADRRYLSEGSMALLDPTPPIALPTHAVEVTTTPELATAKSNLLTSSRPRVTPPGGTQPGHMDGSSKWDHGPRLAGYDRVRLGGT